MHTKTTHHISHVQKDIFWAASITLVALVGMYLFFLGSSVVNVSARQNVNDKIVVLGSKVAQLEFEYVALQNSVTSDMASSKGYVVQSPMAYVAKESRLSLARP